MQYRSENQGGIMLFLAMVAMFMFLASFNFDTKAAYDAIIEAYQNIINSYR